MVSCEEPGEGIDDPLASVPLIPPASLVVKNLHLLVQHADVVLFSFDNIVKMSHQRVLVFYKGKQGIIDPYNLCKPK